MHLATQFYIIANIIRDIELTNKAFHKRYYFFYLLAAWTLLGFFFVIPQYIYSASNDQPFNWYGNLTYRVSNYMLWAFFTPIVYRIVNGLTLSKKHLAKNIRILLFSGIGISLVHRALSIFVTFVIRDLDGELDRGILEALQSARFAILGGSFDSLFVYGLIVSVIVSIIYYRRHRESELLKSQLETKLAEARVELLKSQLQPHFLFNTLNAVTTLMHRDVNLAEKVLARLSDLLRISLDGLGKKSVTLKDELEFLEKYLEIQKIRYEGKIDVEFNVDKTLLDTMLPAFILQPIVENAVKYGVEAETQKQSIQIAAQQHNQHIHLAVKDTGPGIKKNFKQGIGLSNTRDRLKYFFGDNFEFLIKNNNDKGLTVTLKIPKEP